MYKRILVAVDGSGTSNFALREAIKLAKEQQAIVRLVHVVDLSTTYMDVETPWPRAEIQRAYREEGGKILKKAQTAVRKAGIQVDAKLREVDYGGRITEAISDQVTPWQAVAPILDGPITALDRRRSGRTARRGRRRRCRKLFERVHRLGRVHE